jgi:hypothetical protein
MKKQSKLFTKDEEKPVPDNYYELKRVLKEAHDRAAFGKGYERHADYKPFENQDICTELIIFGTGPALFQIRKKAKESLRLSREQARNELLDIIVYAAAAAIVLEGPQ